MEMDPIALAIAMSDAEASGSIPEPVTPSAEDRGFLANVVESVTGSERTTPEIEGMMGWQRLPELNSISPEMLKVTFGGALSQTDELAQIIQEQFPDIKSRRDEKGNYIFRSAQDGAEYAIKPGVSLGDIPRMAFGLLAFTPAGRAATMTRGTVGAMGTEAIIQGGEAATGGEFNPSQVAMAGGGEVLGRSLGAGVSRMFGGVPEVPPGAATPPSALPSPQQAAPGPTQIPPGSAAPGAAPTPQPTAVPGMSAGEQQAADFNALMRKAAIGGAGSEAAREELARQAVSNPAAKEAADRLGMSLEPDILSDHTQLRSAIGLARSQIGSQAQTAWLTSLSDAVTKADEALEAIDGSADLSAISDTIKNNLQNTRNGLESEASRLYRRVDAQINGSMRVNPTNSVQLLNQRITDLGGAAALKGKERELFDAVTDPDTPLTYARLVTTKQDVGRARDGRGGPFADVNEAILKRLYGALAEDQLSAAAQVGGSSLRQELRLANQTTAKQKALEKRIVNAFGKDLDGSVAIKIRSAISGGRKGDISGLNRLIKTVPKELRRETVASAISAMSRSRRALAGNLGTDEVDAPFSFAEYAKLYRDLRTNSEVYKVIAAEIGPSGQKVMRDLYEVSKYVNDASEKIIRTGASNQALISELNAQGAISAAMNSTLGRRATQAVAGAAGAMVGSPLVGAAGGALVGALTEGGKRDGVRAMGDMIASDAFKDLVANAAAGEIPKRAQRRLLSDPLFVRWAKINNVENPSEWLSGVVQGVRRLTTEEEQ
jgi:hypothetical protein